MPDKSPKKSSQTRRNKSNSYASQCKVAKLIADKFSLTSGLVTTEREECDLQPIQQGMAGEDIKFNSVAGKALNISVEVKYGKGYTAMVGAHKQATKNCKGKDPVVFIVPTRSTQTYVVIDSEYYLELLHNKFIPTTPF